MYKWFDYLKYIERAFWVLILGIFLLQCPEKNTDRVVFSDKMGKILSNFDHNLAYVYFREPNSQLAHLILNFLFLL